MSELLTSRFESEFDSYSVQELDLNLTYSDRQHLKVGEYAEVAERMLPILNRRVWWLKASVVLGGLALCTGTILSGAVAMDLVATVKTVEDLSGPLLYAFCLGFAAVIGSWRLASVEKKRILCELIIAEHSESNLESTLAG